MSKVAVQRKVLRWAVDRSGQTMEDLQGKFPKIGQWATSEVAPTLRQLESLAKATLTPLGFFFLDEPPEEGVPIPHFRTLRDRTRSKPSPDLLESIQVMQRRQAWMHEFLIEQGQDPLPFVRSAQPGDQPVSIAERMRHTLRFEAGWADSRGTWTEALRFLSDAMEKAGILVVVNGIVGNNTHRKLKPSEFRGFVLVDEYAPLVFVNGADSKAAQMFTLAHELAHVFFGSSAAFDLRDMQPAEDPTEQACNRAAAEFLVPERHLRQVWPSAQDAPDPFQVIARQFKVSQLVAARRALDLGLIGQTEFLDFYRGYQHNERRTIAARPEGGDFYANQNLRVGRPFASAIVRAVQEGKLLYSEAYHLTGLYGKTFDRYAAAVSARGPY